MKLNLLAEKNKNKNGKSGKNGKNGKSGKNGKIFNNLEKLNIYTYHIIHELKHIIICQVGLVVE